MPSFDVTSEVNWQEVDNAIQQALKEAGSRFDFKGIKSEIQFDKKLKTLTLWCSQEEKLDALNDILQTKLVKRGISLLSLDYQNREAATGGSVRQLIKVQAGISKEKGKEVVQFIKDLRVKAQAQIQDEQVRVTSKSRDELQTILSQLKQGQDQLKLPMQFGNFRD